jgi:hypothetical protein
MNLYPQTGERPEIDLSGIEFKEGYYPPKKGTIAANYQAGFPIDPDLETRWRAGEGHAIATEFVMHYYRSKGFGQSVEVAFIKDDPDCVGGVTITLKDRNGFDYYTFDVWASNGKILIEN